MSTLADYMPDHDKMVKAQKHIDELQIELHTYKIIRANIQRMFEDTVEILGENRCQHKQYLGGRAAAFQLVVMVLDADIKEIKTELKSYGIKTK